jgi:S1-C subfamily serine protease
MTDVFRDLGNELAAAVTAAQPSMVHIERGRGVGATGFAWTAELAVASSAALIGDDGHVHVGEERRAAEVIGRDPGTDVALLRIDGGGMTPLARADLGDVAVGHLALALGRPGMSVRASLRMIGTLGGEVRTPTGGRLDRYLATDRRLPRGFSGGPLVAAGGAALGMNTRALGRGAAVTVPVVTLDRVVTELETHGAIRTGYLGVGVHRVRLPQAIADQLSRRSGALVVSVAENSPAARAGLVLGDVIVAVDGEPIEDPVDLRAALADRADRTVPVELLRAGALTEIEATIGHRGAP